MFDKRLKSPRVRKAEFSFKADALQMNINHLFHLFNFFVSHKNQIIKKTQKKKRNRISIKAETLQPDLCKQTQDVNLWKKNKEMKHKEKENMQVSFWQTQIVIFKEKD